jgi:hypothetical protein
LDPNSSDGYGGRQRYFSNINIELFIECIENFIDFSDEVGLMAAYLDNFLGVGQLEERMGNHNRRSQRMAAGPAAAKLSGIREGGIIQKRRASRKRGKAQGMPSPLRHFLSSGAP